MCVCGQTVDGWGRIFAAGGRVGGVTGRSPPLSPPQRFVCGVALFFVQVLGSHAHFFGSPEPLIGSRYYHIVS